MEHHSGDFSVAVRDIRQYSQQDSEALTLLWVLEGRVGLQGWDRSEVALVAAIGKPKFVTGDMIRPGAIVIDFARVG